MRVISKRALRDFWEVHPSAENPLAAWYRVLERSTFTNFNAPKRAFGATDYVAPFSIFDIGGSKFRVITVIHYNVGRVCIRHVFTHSEYDRWSAEMRRTKNRKRGT